MTIDDILYKLPNKRLEELIHARQERLEAEQKALEEEQNRLERENIRENILSP